MKKYTKTISLFTVFLISIFFLLSNPLSEPKAVDCTTSTTETDYTIEADCAFSSDNTTTTVADSSTNANTGTPTGTTIVTGKYGSARSFNGSSDYINVPHSTSLNISDTVTVEAWVKLNSTGNRWILGKEPVNSTYELFAEGTQFVMRINDCGEGCHNTYGGTQVQGEWAHVAGTYDGQNIRLYVNGSLVNTQPYVAAIATNTSPIQIGAFSNGTAYQMDGLIDDVRVYNYARSETQIREDMGGSSITGNSPVAHWRMDDGYTTGVDDQNLIIPSGKSLTVNAGQTVAWNPGKSLTVDGTININTAGQLKKGYLWVSDPDTDGWYYDATRVIADSQPTGYIRQKDTIGSIFGDGSDGAVTFNTNTTLSTTAVATGRTAPDAPNYRVCNAIGTNYVDTCSAGPVGLWYMDEAANDSCSGGQDACDSSGNSNHGTAGGTAIVSGKYGSAREFDGTDDYISAADSASLDTDGSALTLEAWAYPHDCTGTGDGRQTIVTKAGAYYLNLEAGTCKPSFYWYSLSNPGYHTANNGLPLNQWSHIAAVYNGSSVTIYINGQVDKTVSSVTGTGLKTDWVLIIGGNTTPSRNFDGYIDDVRVYDYARGQNLIEDDMYSWQAAIAPGDTVMLTNLGRDATNYGNVGNYEFLKVESVSGRRITFTTDIKKIYGATTTNTNVAGQSIIIQRVPQYSNATISDGVTVTANSFDGYKDGVFAMQANGTVAINSGAYGGGIDMSEKGYRGANNVQYAGEQGESYKGPGAVNTQTANLGAGGGGGTVANNVAGGGGGSYGAVGTAGKHGSTGGFVGQPGTLGGAVGATYGTTALDKVYMGSGGGSGAYSYTGQSDGGVGGGVVLINAATLSLAGSIKSNGEGGEAGSGPEGTQAGGAGGGSGGSVKISGSSVTLGSELVTATGGAGGGGCYKSCHDSGGGNGGSGRVAVYYLNSLSGTTSPAAYSSKVSDAGSNMYLAEANRIDSENLLSSIFDSFNSLLH